MTKDIHSAEHIAEVLSGIQKRIPPILLKRALKSQKLTPTIEFVVNKALNDPNFPEEKKEKLRTLRDSGEFAKMVPRDDPKIQNMINNFVNREINKEIRRGNLPPKSEVKDVDFIKKVVNKVQENA